MVLANYSYRKNVEIAPSDSGEKTNYQIKIIIHNTSGTDSGNVVYTNSRCRSDFNDIRFTTSNGDTLLDYWIESISGTTAYVWVEIDVVPESGTNIYLYYRNPLATSLSNGDNTFQFFDDFSGVALDTNKWNVIATTPIVYTVSDSYLNITRGGDWGSERSGFQAKQGGTIYAPPNNEFAIECVNSVFTATSLAVGHVGLETTNDTNSIIEVSFNDSWAYGGVNYRGKIGVLSYESSILNNQYFSEGIFSFKITKDENDLVSVFFDIPTSSGYIEFLRGVCTTPMTQVFLEYNSLNYAGTFNIMRYHSIFVRKFARSEPAPTTWGVEESLGIPENDYIYTDSGGYITITGYIGNGGNITIPSVISGLPVTFIGDNAFNGNTNILSVVIPDSITNIGQNAFYQSHITNVNITQYVTTIGQSAFNLCLYLTSIDVDVNNSNYANNMIIVDGQSISDGVLYNKAITEVISYPCGKTGSYTIPDGVIVSPLFQNCAISEIIFGSGITTISRLQMNNCVDLSVISFGVNVNQIDFGFISGCPNVSAYYVAEDNTFYTTKDYALYTFDGETLLGVPTALYQWFVIPIGTKYVSYGAFPSGSQISVIQIPSTVDLSDEHGIYNYQFWYCEKLVAFFVVDSPLYATSADGCLYTKDMTIMIAYPPAKEDISFTVPNGVTEIYPDCFWGYGDFSMEDGYTSYDMVLESVTLADTITTLGDWTFENINSLTTIIIGSGVNTLNHDVVCNCVNVKDIYFKGEVAPTTVDVAWLFNPSADLRGHALSTSDFPSPGNVWNTLLMGDYYVNPLPESYSYLDIGGGDAMIMGYTGAGGDIILPTQLPEHSSPKLNVVSISNSAFENNLTITSVVIPEGIGDINNYAFAGCTSLVSASLPSTIWFTTGSIFGGCTALENVNISEGVDMLGEGMFYGCTSLANVTIPTSVTHIDPACFQGCTALAQISIPNGVEYLSDNAFKGCSNLTHVTIGSNLISIGNNAFGDCPAIIDFTFLGLVAPTASLGWFSPTETAIGHAYLTSNFPPPGEYYYGLLMGDNIPTTTVANFSATPLSGARPLTVQFTNTTQTPTTAWLWDFENNGLHTSTDENPTYTYTVVGTYSVSLRVTDAYGDASVTRTNYITAEMSPPEGTYDGVLVVDLTETYGHGAVFASNHKAITDMLEDFSDGYWEGTINKPKVGE